MSVASAFRDLVKRLLPNTRQQSTRSLISSASVGCQSCSGHLSSCRPCGSTGKIGNRFAPITKAPSPTPR